MVLRANLGGPDGGTSCVLGARSVKRICVMGWGLGIGGAGGEEARTVPVEVEVMVRVGV
jgi:hypothetical protein